MSDLRKLLGLGDDVKLTKGEKQLADLIEQQQARIDEMEQENSSHHNLIMRQSEILRKTAGALKGAPEELSLHSHHDLMDVAHKLVRERDALVAHVERLREAIFDYQNKNHDLNILLVAATKTPQQNLNAVKREAIIESIDAHKNKLMTFDFDTAIRVNDLIHFANKRYPD